MKARKEKKWSLKRDALEELTKKVTNKRLKQGDFTPLVTSLKECLVDVNVNVSISALNCVAALAKGLGTAFSSYGLLLLPCIFDKCKEKKKNVLEPLRCALDAIYEVAEISEVLELCIEGGLSHRNPNVRKESCDFLTRIFCSVDKPIPPTFRDKLCLCLQQLLNDSTPEVRGSAMQTFGTLIKLFGEAALSKYLKELDTIKTAKVKEFSDKAVVKGMKNENVMRNVPQKLIKEPATKLPAKEKHLAKKPALSGLAPKLASKISIKTDSLKRPVSNKKVNEGKQSVTKESCSSNSIDYDKKPKLPEEQLLQAEEAMRILDSTIPASIKTGLNSKLWKERYEASKELLKFLENSVQSRLPLQAFAHYIIHYIKDTNFQVAGTLLQCLLQLFKTGKVTIQSVSVICEAVLDKLPDMKNGKAAGEILKLLCERTSLSHVFEKIYGSALAHKNPKVLSNCLIWLSETIQEFGLLLNLDKSISFAKSCLCHSNPIVRKEAVKFCTILRLLAGAHIEVKFQEVKSPLLLTLQSEFSKVSGMLPPKPTRKIENENFLPAENETISTVEAARTDIRGFLAKEHILKDLKDSNWRTRNEGMLKLQKVFAKANFCVEANIGELPETLYPRLFDTNKNQVALALHVLGDMEKPSSKALTETASQLLAPVIHCFEDRNADVRKKAGTLLSIFMKYLNYESIKSKVETAPISKFSITYALSLLEKAKSGSEVSSSPNESKLSYSTRPSAPENTTASSEEPETITCQYHSLTNEEQIPHAWPLVESKPMKQPAFENSNSDMRVFVFDPDDSSISFDIIVSHHHSVDVNLLKKLMLQCVQRALFYQLFSEANREKLEGLQTLCEACSSEQNNKALVKCLPLLLYYANWLLTLPSSPLHLKALELLESLLNWTSYFGGRLSDQQISLFIGALFEKFEDVSTCEKAKLLLRTLCSCYPSNKVFLLLLEAAKSEKMLIRKLCFEEMEGVLEKYGITILPKNFLELLLFAFDSEDKSVKRSVFSFFKKCYSKVGPKMLEKLKGLSYSYHKILCIELGLGEAETALEKNFSVNQKSNTTLSTNEPNNPDTTAVIGSESKSLDLLLIDILNVEDITSTISSLEDLQRRLLSTNKEVADYPFSNILMPLTIQLKFSLRKIRDSALSNHPDDIKNEIQLFRAVYGALVVLIERHGGFKSITSEELSPLIREVLSFLSNQTACVTCDAHFGPLVTRAVNDLASHILKLSDKTIMLCTLLDLLTESARFSDVNFVHFVLKGMWKLCKPMKDKPELVMSLDWKVIYASLNQFFRAHPAKCWQEIFWRNKEEDQPCRTAKTIVSLPVRYFPAEYIENTLKELNVKKGEMLYEYALKFIRIKNPQYQFSSAFTKCPEQEVSDCNESEIAPSTLALVRNIFERLETKIRQPAFEECELQELVKELFRIQREFPESLKVLPKLINKFPNFYKTYIRRNLDYMQHEQNSLLTSSLPLQGKAFLNETSGKDEITARLDRLKRETFMDVDK
ncbi:cytoskeleton-associated protein 5-A-like [Zophobas morio]|uniref:cytoskeleton-associated protein 5-A-like n=1 Tax=Zophobas morio TaxID=2755281 RepID=UPI00308394F1